MTAKRTRLRRFYAKKICVIARILCSKKAYDRRKIDVKPSKCRDFTQILTVFSLVVIMGVISLQKCRSVDTLRQFCAKENCAKKARARAYARLYVDFTQIFARHRIFFRAKTSSPFVGCVTAIFTEKERKTRWSRAPAGKKGLNIQPALKRKPQW